MFILETSMSTEICPKINFLFQNLQFPKQKIKNIFLNLYSNKTQLSQNNIQIINKANKKTKHF